MSDITRHTNCTTGGPVFVYVKDGKILRMTPIEFDETDAPSWTIEARGQSFSPPRKTTASPWTVAHRSTVYSPKRILTPLRRVDFDTATACEGTNDVVCIEEGSQAHNALLRGVDNTLAYSLRWMPAAEREGEEE